MIEIPESIIISRQATGILTGRRIAKVVNATSPHKFTWYNGDPAEYPILLEGRQIEAVRGYGSYVDLVMDEETHLLGCDGTIMRYYRADELQPARHQQLIVLDDGSFLGFTVAMYGGIYAFRGRYDNPYYQGSVHKLNPLNSQFDEAYFEKMIARAKPTLSAKALLATGQRIPGLGNTYKNPCPNCGHEIVREAYLGGTVYYCPVCQKL